MGKVRRSLREQRLNRSRLFTSGVILAALMLAFCQRAAADHTLITLNPQTTYQTMTGWEATGQAGQTDIPAFPQYKDTLFEQAVNDLGINRLRLEISRNSGPAGRQTGSGFDLGEMDTTIETVVLPIRKLLQARGENLFVNVTVVGKGYAHDPNGYAQAALEALQHMQTKYGFLPDSWEVALEPDNFGWENPTNVANALVATGNLFGAKGYNLPFVAPSNTNMTSAVGWFDAIMQAPGSAQYLKEFSYHRYGGVSITSLKAIAGRAQHYGINTSMLEHIGSGVEDLYQDLTVGQNSAWSEYALAYREKTEEGGLYFRIDDSNPSAPKVIMDSRAKLLRQYFRFIRRGALRIGAQTTDDRFAPVGFVNSNRAFVVVVKASGGGSISIQGLPPATYGINYTTDQEYAVDLPDQTITAGHALTTAIPNKGVITIYGKASPPVAPTLAQSAVITMGSASPSAFAPTSTSTSTPAENPTPANSSAEAENPSWWLPISFLVAAVATVVCIGFLRFSRRIRERVKN
jgi:hypothetical protein